MKKKKDDKKRTMLDLLLFFVLPLVLILGFFGVRYVVRSVGASNTLDTFYEALYVSPDIDAASECLYTNVREDFRTALTLGNADESFYKQYQNEAVSLFGEDITVSVSVKSVKTVSGSAYSDASDHIRVVYTINMKGSEGRESYENSLELIRVDGAWQMLGYLKLPVGYNLRIE